MSPTATVFAIRHELKSVPEHFQAVWERRKTAEIRKNDRGGFTEGQVLLLREWNPVNNTYSGREILAEITPISAFQQQTDYLVLSIQIFDVKGGCR